MANDIEIRPRAATPVAPAPAAPPTAEAQITPEPESTQAGGLPDELIAHPVMQALMAGQPPAVSGDIKAAGGTELGQLVGKYGKDLMGAGFGFYRSQDGNLGVVFNQLFLPPEELQRADQAGNLTSVAPPFDAVEQAMLSDPQNNPVLTAQTPSAPPIAAPGGGAPPPQAGGAPPAGKVQRTLASARRSALETGKPTSGPRPGAGRIINSILKPVV